MRQRIITGLIAGFVFLAFLVIGGYGYAALIVLLACIGFFEYVRMNHMRLGDVSVVIAYVGLLLIVPPWENIGIPLPSTEWLIWSALFVLLAITVFTKNRIQLDQAALLFLGLIYIGFGFRYMIHMRLLEHGLFWALFVFSCIWASDSGAYFTGRIWGKTPLWPAISPKKTVEGSLGGIALSAVVAICFALYAPQLLSVFHAALTGVIIAVVGQVGDLIQSAYKRVRGIKDTGAILPGHGGILDRCDSWLIVFPFVYFFSLLL